MVTGGNDEAVYVRVSVGPRPPTNLAMAPYNKEVMRLFRTERESRGVGAGGPREYLGSYRSSWE